MDELEFAQQFRPSGPVTIGDIFRRQLAPDWEDVEAARREREEAAAREERAETIRLANHQFGDPLGNLTRSQMAAAEARDRVRALEDQLEEARRVLHRCAEDYVTWQEQAQMVTATAQRSATDDLLAPAKKALAEARVERMLAQRSAQAAPRRERPPFGGEAVRSHLECVYCLQENVDAETSALLHHDPELAVPITSPEQAAAANQAAKAERHAYSYAGEISR